MKTNKAGTKGKFTITLGLKLNQRLREEAFKTENTKSNIVEKALEEYFSKRA